ncbi:hypothetical protein U1Q18_031543, partial [Sarracenia purpurea var. burkii]
MLMGADLVSTGMIDEDGEVASSSMVALARTAVGTDHKPIALERPDPAVHQRHPEPEHSPSEDTL